MTDPYPIGEPYDRGMLDVGDDQLIYWEQCGNPNGKPAVVLHGGPGSGCTPGWRRFFDPEAYRIILFDQRGCGRSTPHASDPLTSLATNTTDHLISDIEALRRHLAIERWLVLGGSWGSTLGLAYAQQYPQAVSEAVFFAVGTTTHREVDWITRHVGRLFPDEWQRFRDAVPESERDGNLTDAYARLLNDPDPAVREQAARDWCAWEDTHVQLPPKRAHDPRYDDPRFRMAFARLVTHYWRHAAFCEDGALMRGAARLADIPAVLIHNRLDLSSPLDVPWQLARTWPGAELIVVAESGHVQSGIERALVAATDGFVCRQL